MKYGLTAGLAYIVFTLALYFLGMEKSQGMGMIGYLILLGAQFLGVKEIRDAEQDGYITFGTAWKKGVFIALIAGLLGSIYMMIHLSYINPEMLQEVLTEAEVQMEESGASSEEIEMGMKMAGMFATPWMTALFTMLGFGLLGILLSLIPAAVLKNEKTEVLE
jgi:hypothetical protein